MSVSIRIAGPEDRDRIVLFNRAMGRETEGRELDAAVLTRGVEAFLRDGTSGRYYLAEKSEEVVGQAAVTFEWSDWRNARIWWIQSVYVSRQHRREGIYRLLHRHVREVARQEGAAGLRLYVDRDNHPAQATYLALGMKQSNYLMFEEMWA